jgi:hypothetical protein
MSTNLHDYLERINAPAPDADEQSLKVALANVAWCSRVEEAAALIIKEVFCGAVFHDRSLSLTPSTLSRFFRCRSEALT